MGNLRNGIRALFDIERLQDLIVSVLGIVGRMPMLRAAVRSRYGFSHPTICREAFGMRFRNPVGVAAGLDRNGTIFRALDALGFGFTEIGTVTPLPQGGNPRPRLAFLEDEGAIVNNIGLASRGVEYVVRHLRHDRGNIILGCNIGKNTITSPEEAWKDYLKVFRQLYSYVDFFTVNVSSNTTFTHYVPSDRESLMRILGPLFDFRRGQGQYRPILLKISPDLTDVEIDMVTDLMMESPLDGMVAVNATLSRDGLPASGRKWRPERGAVSGRPLKRRALEVVRRISSRCGGQYPIIGCGGLMSAVDVREMLEAGATMVEVMTGYMNYGPRFAEDVCRSLVRAEYHAKDGKQRFGNEGNDSNDR